MRPVRLPGHGGAAMTACPPAGPRARHLAKMQEGRARAIRERRLEALERVRVFRAWLAAGSPIGQMPECHRTGISKLERAMKR